MISPQELQEEIKCHEVFRIVPGIDPRAVKKIDEGGRHKPPQRYHYQLLAHNQPPGLSCISVAADVSKIREGETQFLDRIMAFVPTGKKLIGVIHMRNPLCMYNGLWHPENTEVTYCDLNRGKVFEADAFGLKVSDFFDQNCRDISDNDVRLDPLIGMIVRMDPTGINVELGEMPFVSVPFFPGVPGIQGKYTTDGSVGLVFSQS